jgi:zinc/manganese transport system substrate-binding protein
VRVRRFPPATRVGALLAAAALALTGCASSGRPAPRDGRLQVVAAENAWGSIAAQLGGDRVRVTSIVVSPDADPHDYEPTPRDARTMATANYVVVNGVGYDPWATKLAKATSGDGRTVLTVGDLVGARNGDNPHRWYSPEDVRRVVGRISADYSRLDPAHADYFVQQRQRFEGQDLRGYSTLIADIKARHHGTPVGASESIFAPLAADLGLDLVTPASFLSAISEGSDPSARDKATIDAQIHDRKIKLYVYNSQNATPDVQRQVAEARQAGIPVATITETLTPATASFQAWQTRQLQALAAALAQGTGR